MLINSIIIFFYMVLIIENNINIAALFKESLDLYNIDFKLARSGVEAYKILYNSPEFDLIITNIGLPDENGIEIIKFIKEKFNSKIIIYTGKKFSYYKNMVDMYDYIFDKRITSPADIVSIISEI